MNRFPVAGLLFALSGLPLAFVFWLEFGSVTWSLVGLFAPAVLFYLVSWELGRSSLAVSHRKVPFRALLTAVLALSLGLAVVIGGSYLQLFWLIGLVGLASTVIWWNHRSSNGFRAALAFVGVFVAVYGILAVIIQLLVVSGRTETG